MPEVLISPRKVFLKMLRGAVVIVIFTMFRVTILENYRLEFFRKCLRRELSFVKNEFFCKLHLLYVG